MSALTSEDTLYLVTEFVLDSEGNKGIVEVWRCKGEKMRDKIKAEIAEEGHGYSVVEA